MNERSGEVTGSSFAESFLRSLRIVRSPTSASDSNGTATSDRQCDFTELARTVTGTVVLGSYSIHGPAHGRRVERNGLWLAERSGGDPFVVWLFAQFHDSCRINEWTDPDHGKRGAVYAFKLRGTLLDLDDEAFDRLLYACTWHTKKDHSDDPTVGACWDADRLDLGRVGKTPALRFMSTKAGKDAVEADHAFLSHAVNP